jgi:hypothetical protein
MAGLWIGHFFAAMEFLLETISNFVILAEPARPAF